MKILLLTDFSELSSFMRNVADKIAHKLDAEVFVLNVVNIPSEMPKLDLETIDMQCASDPMIYVEKRAHSLERIDAFVKDMKANTKTLVYYGGIRDTILEVVEENNIDFLAMGTVYARGVKNFFNNTLLESIIKEIDIPVLSLKCNRDDVSFEHILLHCNSNYKNMYDFRIMLAIKKAFNSKLHMIHTLKKGENEGDLLDRMKAFAEKYDLKPDIMKVVRASSDEDGVINYVEEFEKTGEGTIELITVKKKLRTDFGKFFLGSRAAKFVNHVGRPILTVTSK
jgi:nucleotide-binding universal stress UspA family protein